MKKFFSALEQKNYKNALDYLISLEESKQLELMDAVYQQYKSSASPKFVSVLSRTLKPSKNIDDFYKAWLPPQQDSNTDRDFMNYFSKPTSVTIAESTKDPHNIITIGNIWASTNEVDLELKEIANKEKQRHESINKVANKTFGQLYEVKYHHKLGSKFK